MRIKRYKIRFNLGEGENKWKWKITFPDGKVEYHHPNTVQLIMTGCQLHNSKSTAQKIFEGGEKVVCAWILCEEVRLRAWVHQPNGQPLKYNPRITPNWDLNWRNVDGQHFDFIYSVGNKLFVK